MSKVLFNKVTIIGIGLIGGSLAIDLKKKNLAKEIVGVASHQSTIDKARSMGIIDWGVLDPVRAAKDSDLIVFGTPVGIMVSICKQIAPVLKKGCIISDVGSTKGEIVGRMEDIVPKGRFFVGAHPIAGSEKRGIDNAVDGLFSDHSCIITKTNKTSKTALNKIEKLWKMLGSATFIMSAAEHDEIFAYVSHLPHLLACGLVNINEPRLSYAAGGFCDMTRIASGDAVLWRDIFFSNKECLNKAISDLASWLERMSQVILKGDDKIMLKELKKARSNRGKVASCANAKTAKKNIQGKEKTSKEKNNKKIVLTKKNMVIAIDGPTACGKSSVAKLVAKKLNIAYLDSGALYRAVTFSVLSAGISPTDEKAVIKHVDKLDLQINASSTSFKVLVNGKDITSKLRQSKVTKSVAHIAKIAKVRARVVKYQRSMVKNGVVAEGRDMCTTVFPKADVKVYLDARLSERIKRRTEDLQSLGRKIDEDIVEKEVRERDMIDRQRKTSPLTIASDATYVDTTRLSVEKACERILSFIS